MTVKSMGKIETLLRWSSQRLPMARLARDTSGLAAVEFAMIVPLMLVMFFGTIEISNGVAADRKVSIIAQSISDLTSRYTSVSDTDISNFRAIAVAILTPYGATSLKATITEAYIDPATGVARSQWSKGDVPRALKSTVPVPAALIARDSSNKIIAGQYLIFSEVSYVYTPAVGFVMNKLGVTLTDQTYTRPRGSTCVFYPSVPTDNVCPTS
ncbi:pilus assembly protein [soil metagenome]